MDSADYEMLTLHGSWAREWQIDRRPIGYGKTSVSSC
jgi:alpha-galactosidase